MSNDRLLHARSARLAARLEQRLSTGGKLLLTFLTAGYPDRETCIELLVKLATEGGVDILEIGVPFSDPLADGPTIQAASQEALANGMTLKGALAIAHEVRQRVPEVPIILMGYLNPFLAFGRQRLPQAAREAGVDGFIIPDLLPQEDPELETALREHELDWIQMLAPTSKPQRMAWIDEHASGFLYLVAVTGVTGARRSLPETLGPFCGSVREHVRHPFIVGFGISSPEVAAAAAELSNGVVVGSALIDRLAGAREAGGDPAAAALEFVKGLRSALA